MSIKDKKHILGGPPIMKVTVGEAAKKLGKIQQENAHRAANPKKIKRSKMG